MNLHAMLAAPDHQWSVGTTAGVMGYTPSATGDGAAGDAIGRNGAASLRLDGAPLFLAFETISADPFGWNHGIALCVTARGTPGSGRISACGPDVKAIRTEDRARPVWDMGCGDGVGRVLFRPDDSAAMAAFDGRAWHEAETARLSGTWILETVVARLEQTHPAGPLPIYRPGGRPPATTPLPQGWHAAAHVFPPHPARACPGLPAAFDPVRHAAFQSLLARHGRPDLWQLKQRVSAQINAGKFEDIDTDRHGMTAIRVALRQALSQTGLPPPEPWLRRYDPALCRALRKRQAH